MDAELGCSALGPDDARAVKRWELDHRAGIVRAEREVNSALPKLRAAVTTGSFGATAECMFDDDKLLAGIDQALTS
jgi:hypothetical protein